MGSLVLIFIFLLNLYSEIYTDSLGRTINLDKPPKKIIGVGAGALRMIVYLDAIDLVCGVENIEIKNPKGKPYAVAYYEKIKKLPVFGEGGPEKRPDYERIIKLDPDLIIASSVSDAFVSELIEKTGKKVAVIDYGIMGGFEVERFKDAIEKLAMMLKKEKRAEFILKRMDSYIADIKKRIGNKKQEKSVYVGGIGFKGSHGIGSTQTDHEPFKIIGVKSVVDGISKRSKIKHIFIDKETLLSLNPDIIFLDIGGLSIIEDDFKLSPDYYNALSAFKNNNLYTTLPFNYYTTNVEIVLVNSYFYAKVLWSDSFKDIEMKNICSRIFKDFLGKDVCESFIENKNFYKRVIISNGAFTYH